MNSLYHGLPRTVPFGLLKYALRRRYPAGPDLPATPALRRSYDVVVIGGGGHGLATAYYLARHWSIRSVCVLERSYIGGGNTGRNTAVIRSNYSTPESVRFHKEGVELYRGLSAELGFNLMYSRRGQLNLAHSEGTVRAFRLRAEANKLYGVVSEMIDRAQIRAMVPFLELDRHRAPVLAGLWHADGGTGRHDAVAWGYARRAAQMGVEIHQQTPVTGIRVEHGRVLGVDTPRGHVAAGHVVQAVAGRSSEVALMAGIRLPIRTMPLQAMVTQPLKPFLDPLVSSAEYHTYIQQTSRGELVIGGNTDHYELCSTRVTLDVKESMAAHTLELFPFLGEVRVMRQWAGMCDVTPDASPIIGASPVANYWLDAGTGTWGFKATPVTGKYLAQAVAQGRVPDVIAPYRLDRFTTFDLVNEMGSSAISH
jgi:sarcosine oxidase subunit beta